MLWNDLCTYIRLSFFYSVKLAKLLCCRDCNPSLPSLPHFHQICKLPESSFSIWPFHCLFLYQYLKQNSSPGLRMGWTTFLLPASIAISSGRAEPLLWFITLTFPPSLFYFISGEERKAGNIASEKQIALWQTLQLTDPKHLLNENNVINTSMVLRIITLIPWKDPSTFGCRY